MAMTTCYNEKDSTRVRWMKLVDEIPDKAIMTGTRKLIGEYIGKLLWAPSSVSGKYHQHQPLLIDHIEDCMVYAKVLAEGFNLDDIERSILFSATILHDIAKCENLENTSLHGNSKGKWKEYQGGKYYFNTDGMSHALLGQAIIGKHSFSKSNVIGKMVACHGGHWYKYCPQAETFLERLMVAIDYLSSNIIVDEVVKE